MRWHIFLPTMWRKKLCREEVFFNLFSSKLLELTDEALMGFHCDETVVVLSLKEIISHGCMQTQ